MAEIETYETATVYWVIERGNPDAWITAREAIDLEDMR